MNILVTGATGFLGQKLTIRLANMGYSVTGLGRNGKIGASLEKHGIKFISCSLEDRESILSLCRDKDYVFHSGALSSPWGKYKHFYEANVVGTQNVLDGSMKSGIKRFIHVSTPSLYFHYDERLDVKEHDTLPSTFVNHYAKTKFMAEQLVDAAYQNGLPTITIRPRALFGPGDNAILPRLIKVCEKGVFPRIGKEDVLVDITYVENVVDSLLLCMKADNTYLGEKYNITNGVRVNLYNVIEEIMGLLGKEFKYRNISFNKAFRLANALELISKTVLLGKEPVLTRYSVSVLSKSQTLNIDKAKQELGYSPSVSIEEGIRNFVDWWKEHEN